MGDGGFVGDEGFDGAYDAGGIPVDEGVEMVILGAVGVVYP